MHDSFLCGRFEFDLKRPLVMGIVNVTPDSFSDGGLFFDADAAIAHARELIAQGADILDLGGESTRPGALAVSAEDETARLLPVVEALRTDGIALSVDTSKAVVMRAVLDAGADMINDVYAFRQPEAVAAVAHRSCGVCAMHMQGEPRTMQEAPAYDDVMDDVVDFLNERAQCLQAAGVSRRRVMLDPGFGFGKTVAQNYQLLRQLSTLIHRTGFPILTGLSRKSMIGAIVNRPAPERLAGSLSAMLACVMHGSSIVRVHDDAATVDAVRVWQTIEQGM